jgi:Flp pilus assembly protein TadD
MSQTTERIQKLQQMLENSPDDTFLLYAIALEHKKHSDFPQALRYLDQVLQKDPTYAVAYHQAGLVHELAGDLESARKSYREGMEVAARKGNDHAREEMHAALMLIE